MGRMIVVTLLTNFSVWCIIFREFGSMRTEQNFPLSVLYIYKSYIRQNAIIASHFTLAERRRERLRSLVLLLILCFTLFDLRSSVTALRKAGIKWQKIKTKTVT